ERLRPLGENGTARRRGAYREAPYQPERGAARGGTEWSVGGGAAHRLGEEGDDGLVARGHRRDEVVAVLVAKLEAERRAAVPEGEQLGNGRAHVLGGEGRRQDQGKDAGEGPSHGRSRVENSAQHTPQTARAANRGPGSVP